MASTAPVPEWPSLYSLAVELLPHQMPELRGRYIARANDIFRFTFYWMLIFHAPLFIFSGAFAFANIVYPPKRHHYDLELEPSPTAAPLRTTIPLTPISARRRSLDPLLSFSSEPTHTSQPARHSVSRAPQEGMVFPVRKVRRTRAAYGLIVLFTFLVYAVASALIKSLVVGYILAGVYSAAKFRMSTWVPFVWALLITASSTLGVFPSVIDRI